MEYTGAETNRKLILFCSLKKFVHCIHYRYIIEKKKILAQINMK